MRLALIVLLALCLSIPATAIEDSRVPGESHDSDRSRCETTFDGKC